MHFQGRNKGSGLGAVSTGSIHMWHTYMTIDLILVLIFIDSVHSKIKYLHINDIVLVD